MRKHSKHTDMEVSLLSSSEDQSYDQMKVVVAVDESDESFYALQWLLNEFLFSSEDQSYVLTNLHVKEPFPSLVFPGMHAVFPTTSIIQSVHKAQEESASIVVTRALHMCNQRKVEAKAIVLEGDPKDMICDFAERMNVDLIVIGSRGLGKIERAFMGSVSDYVVHHAKCSVLIIKPPNKYRK